VDLNLVRDLRIEGGKVTVDLQSQPLPEGMLEALVAEIERAVGALEGVSEVEVLVLAAEGEGATPDLGPLPGVTDVVAVSSAKGGVGKSTVAVNLACALSEDGRRVGLLDTDVYGPSLPTMIGVSDRPQVVGESKIAPLEKHGIKLMSMGFFVGDHTPVIWRGPMVTGLIRQFLKDVEWGELDIMVIDLPPGTGDAQLTLVQNVPLSGGVIVTTPQRVSLNDVERGVAMFHQVNTPVLGVVENMSAYVCPQCGKEHALFGRGGGARIAETFGVPLLGQIPLVPEVRTGGDLGNPIILDQPGHPVSRIFAEIGQSILRVLDSTRQETRGPRIVG
jgi:ATP-binding protein involved in chromosome partitioning